MNPTLRPMRLGEILDRAVLLLRTNLSLFIGIALPPGIALFGYSTALDFVRVEGHGGVKAIASLGVIVFSIANLIVGSVAVAAKCWVTSQLVLDRPVTVRSAYGAFRNRKASLVGLAITQSLMSFWPAVILFIMVTASLSAFGTKASSAVTAVIVALCLVPCALVWARYLLAFPAAAILGTNVSQSIDRSVTLGEGFRWKVMWTAALPTGILLALEWSGDWLIGLLCGFNSFGRHAEFLTPFIANFWNLLVGLVFLPLESIALTLVYYDLCVRKEGLDVALMMEQAGMPAGEPIAALSDTGGEPA